MPDEGVSDIKPSKRRRYTNARLGTELNDTQEMSFAQRLHFEQHKRCGMSQKGDKAAAIEPDGQELKPNKFRRENKNRPREQSSKRPVPRYREVLEAGKRQIRDPRFDDTSGTLQPDVFRKRYSFLYDEQLPTEKQELQKKLKKSKSVVQKKSLQGDITKIQQQINAEHAHRKVLAANTIAKKKEKEAIKSGKRPFYVKRSEQKRQELVQRYNDLKASGRLQ